MILTAVTLIIAAKPLLQQCYNIADTLIVGQCIGADALAAVKLQICTVRYLI